MHATDERRFEPRILISHRCQLIALGLLETLRRVAACQVIGPDDGLFEATDRSTSALRLVLGDEAFVARALRAWAARPAPDMPSGRPRFFIVDTQAHREDADDAPPAGVDGTLLVPCHDPSMLERLRTLASPDAKAPPGADRGLSPGILATVLAMLDERLSENVRVAELAKLAGLSECHFSRAFRHSVGEPPHQYVLKRRIAQAVHVVQDPRVPLTKIALDSGFADQSHFTRTFRRFQGVSPSAFRRNGAPHRPHVH